VVRVASVSLPRSHRAASTDILGGEEGLRSLCTPKSIIHDRLFSLIRTPIPKVVGKSRPYIQDQAKYQTFLFLIQRFHGVSYMVWCGRHMEVYGRKWQELVN
jgi:hypothetical protein